ncbi:hypothetical protein NPS01_22190 [Nocardioides psychrotolerans]|uniref:Uridine kinase n=1 Tax=Nocardioides psychrotolerans TaxID=1005945 RepID=A0A1I3KRT5_9ACTN|nr:4-amino-4-deoxy-L-arabinose transferase [Nocardioides psychrotolerans]GEP38556.1 hypothetical protein NPS01_22190 [Nocardioides psychrotolerans]SFI75241.1 Uridine kinase [Nocardioides psychrotolerans]
MATVSPSEVAGIVVDLLGSRSATLGAGRLLCLDGPAGSGKTTLAGAVATLTGSPVVHMDDLYDGWGGLPGVADQLSTILDPLAAGRPGSYRRYDWVAEAYVETRTVPPAPLLVLEGVGSGSAAHAALCTVLVWVEVPADLRLTRGVARDGVRLQEQWRRWMVDEARHFAREGTRERADLAVDGTGVELPRVTDAPPANQDPPGSVT